MDCPAQTTITPYTVIRRERRLPVRGEVLVGLGDHVAPMDVIARGERYTETCLIDVAFALGVRDDRVAELMNKRVGELVLAGEVIASRKGPLGLPGRSCRFPRDGVIVAAKRGRVVIQTAPGPVEVTAGLRGKVVRLIADFGAVIEAEGGLIQGVCGLGGEAAGIVKVTVKGPSEALTGDAVDVSCQGYVLVGGSIDRATLDKASEMKVKAVIVGGAHADVAAVNEAGFVRCPLVVTEALGALSMSDAAFNLLQSNEGQEVYINGIHPDNVCGAGPRVGRGARAPAGEEHQVCRPEVILFTPGHGAGLEPQACQAQSRDLLVGATVRVTREPHLGRLGVVRSLPAVSVSMRPAAALPGADVELGADSVVSVPVRNLELVH